MANYLLFDIGGTNTRLAVSRDGRRFGQPIIFRTPKRFDVAMKTISQRAHALAPGKITIASGGVAGPFNREKTKMVNSPHLGNWVNQPLKRTLEQKLKAKVLINNDAAVVGLGEATHGAGRGYDIVAYITVSTGVGGARIVHGRIDDSAHGFEPGHQNVFGAKNLEQVISGTSVRRRFGKPAYKITSKAVWRQLADTLARGLVNISVLWSPDVIVLGGSMMKTPGISISETNKRLKKHLTIFPRPPQVIHSSLKDIGGLYGSLQMIASHKQR